MVIVQPSRDDAKRLPGDMPSESAPELRAGAEGADLLVLQFARPSDRPGSNPAELAKRDPGAYRHRPGAPAGESVQR